MTDDLLTQLGIGGAFAVIVVREVLGIVKRDNGNGYGAMTKAIAELQRDVTWLRDVHAPVDDDGVPKWYVRASLEKALIKLIDVTEAQTAILRDIRRDLEALKNHGDG